MRSALESMFMSGLMGGIGGGVVGAVSRYANKVKPILETAEQLRAAGYPMAAAETEKTAEIAATEQYWQDVAKAQKRAVEHTQANEGPLTERAAYGRTGDVYDVFGNIQRKPPADDGGPGVTFQGQPLARAQSDAGLVSAEGAQDAKTPLYDAFGKVQRKVGEPKNEKAQSVPSVQKADEPARLPQKEVAPSQPAAAPSTPSWISSSAQSVADSTSPLVRGQIADLSAQRLTAKEIAGRLGITEDTVRLVRVADGIPPWTNSTNQAGGQIESPEFTAWLAARKSKGAQPPAAPAAPAAPSPEPVTPAAAKPVEQMTPEEWKAASKLRPAIRFTDENGGVVEGRAGDIHATIELPESSQMRPRESGWVKGGKFLTPNEAAEIQGQGDARRANRDAETKQKLAITEAQLERRPVSAAAVESYGIKLPEGWTQRGDLWHPPEAKPTPQAPAPGVKEQIDRIVSMAEQPMPKIVESVELLYNDGKWRSPIGGAPMGVSAVSPVQRRIAGYVIQNPEGTTGGVRLKTREEQEQRQRERIERTSAEFRKALEEMTPEQLALQEKYWTDEKAKRERLAAPLPSQKKPGAEDSDAAKLRDLQKVRYKTAAQEKNIEILKARVAADPSKWKVGDGISYKVNSGGVGSQTNRGFRIVRINPESKLALVRSVADTGLTSSGGDADRIGDQWIHVAELKRDKKYDAPTPAPAAQTPLQRDWTALKAQAPESLVAVRLGDFYEFFNDDAVVSAEAMGVALTKRNGVAMSGIPIHAAEGYFKKLTDAGHKVAIADMVDGKRAITETRTPAPAPSPAVPQAEGGIFGYSWADIRSKQQGGTLAALIRGNAPKATESDFAVLEKHGMDWLYDNEKSGIIDRLGLPVERPSKKAVEAKPTAAKVGILPKSNSLRRGDTIEVLSGPYKGMRKVEGYDMSEGGEVYVRDEKTGMDVPVGANNWKLAPAPVTEAAALRAKIVKGATVEVSLVRGSKLTHRAKVQDVDTQNGVVTVTFKKGKKFNGGETQTVRLDQVAPLKSVQTRMLNEVQFEGMTEDQKRQTKADAKEFDRLVRDHPEMGWYNWRVDDLAGTKSGDMDITAERKRASMEAMEALGGDPTWIHKDNSVMKAELLPKLKAAIEEKAHELAREASDSALSDDTDLLPQGEAPATPKLRPSDGKGTGELLQGDAAPFNLVAETAADIAKREAREAAEQVAKEAKDAADAKAKQDKEQGNLFDEDPFAIADAAPTTSLPVASVQRAVRVVAERLAGAMPHEVIADGSAFPDRVKEVFLERYGASGDLNRIRGAVVDGKIWINAAAIENPRQAIETFMHEAAGHGGTDMLLQAFGEKATAQLDAMLKRLFPDEHAAVKRSYPSREQVSETLAKIMEGVGPEMSAQHRTRWQRVVDWLRNALNKLGVKQWSTNDVMALLRRGVDAVRKQRAVTPDAGAVRMSYAGEKAQVPQFMRDSLDTAKAMAAAGKTSKEIRAVTGWFPGKYDGKMRWEVPDEGATWTDKAAAANESGGWAGLPLEDVLDHPSLFEVYPSARNIRTSRYNLGSKSIGGRWDGKRLELNSLSSDAESFSSLLHEVQHWIQENEGFAQGADPAQFLTDSPVLPETVAARVSEISKEIDALREEERALGEFFRNLPDSQKGVGRQVDKSRRLEAISSEIRKLREEEYSLKKPHRDAAAIKDYRRTAGEIESRDVQARQNFTPEQRKAVEPYSSENIAKEDAIVMRGGGPQMSIAGRVTPEQDRAYADAVKRGDMETAQRMVDAAAKAAGYDVGPLWHGGAKVTSYQTPLFLSPYEKVSESYRRNRALDGGDTATQRMFARAKNPAGDADVLAVAKRLGIEGMNEEDSRPHEFLSVGMIGADQVNRVITELKKQGFDSAHTDGDFSMDDPFSEYDSWTIFDPSQIKSANPITRDASGRVIPLSERFNPDTSDIRFSLKDENPEATSTKRAFTDAARAARGEEPTGVITKPSIEALKEGALEELARNPDAGRELVREIIGTAGQPDITPEKEALLAMHRRTLQNEIEMQSDRAMDESLTPEQREIANERWDDLEQEITELEDATNRTGSAWSNWGRIRMQETLRDFSFAMLTKRARKIKGGEQLTRDERAELKAQADAIIALHEKELARRTKLANLERDEAAAAAFQQGKAEAEREAEENQPDPLVTAHSRQFIANLRAKAAPAVRRVKGIFDKGIGSKAGGESDVKMSLAPDPEKPAWFNDVALAGSAQMAEKNLSKEKWLASLKVLTGDTEGNLDPYADELWTASRTILEAEISADTGESKRVKTAKMKRNASKEQLIEGMAERVAEDGDTSNLGRYLKKLAVKLIGDGVDTREALVDAMHDAVKDIDPSLTREAVMDLWSDYGKFRPATTDEVKVKAAQLRGEVQQVRKLMDMEKGLAAKLTGIGRVEPSAEHRKLTKQVEDAKRRGGFTVTDPARQLRTAMDAIQTRLKNEIADMDYAIATRKPLAEHKNAIVYDAVTKGLKAQRDAKKAEYEKLFPKDTAAADLAAIVRALDRSIAELSEQIKAGQLYPGKQGKKLTSPEIEAKRARIEALRDERTVLRGLDTARVEAAKTAAAQARIDELNRQRAAGWPDSPAGTPTVDTPELAALKARRDALLKERQTAQRPPTDPEMRRIEALDKLIAEKQAKIAAGDTSSKPKSQNVKTAEVTAKEAELRRLTVELAKLRNSDIARQLEQLKSRKSRQLADLLEKIAKKDFEPKAKPPEKPTDPELQSIDFQVSQAKGAIMEGMADLARSRRTRLEKTKDTTADVFHTARALMTGGEFSGVFRQGKLAALSHPVITFGQAVPAMFKAFRSAEGEHAEMNKIWARPNAAAYKRSGLALHNPWDFTAAQLEGNYRSRWANKIPFIAGSGRAYTLFLNNLRAGLYDTMSASLSSTEGALTAAQEKEISNFINKMTGSGNLGGRGQKASEYLNIFFFAPKFVASRFQMITGAVKAAGDVATGFQFAKENKAVRKLIAKEYGKILTGIAVMYALYAAFRGDDEPIETDPRSSKFGKIPMGNGTYVDPLAGLSQVTVFLNTLLTGEVKNKKGNIRSVWADDDGSNEFGKGDGAFFTRFVRSKMSPVAGLFYDRFVTHKFVDGKPFAYKDAVLNLATPMTYGDIYDAMRAQGVPKGTALSILALFGEGVNTYESDSKPTHARRYSR
jgi:hypothetical protein